MTPNEEESWFWRWWMKDAKWYEFWLPQSGPRGGFVMACLIYVLWNLISCDTSYDRGMSANIQTWGEYSRFRADHPNWDPNQNAPQYFDPEKGGWR